MSEEEETYKKGKLSLSLSLSYTNTPSLRVTCLSKLMRNEQMDKKSFIEKQAQSQFNLLSKSKILACYKVVKWNCKNLR